MHLWSDSHGYCAGCLAPFGRWKRSPRLDNFFQILCFQKGIFSMSEFQHTYYKKPTDNWPPKIPLASNHHHPQAEGYSILGSVAIIQLRMYLWYLQWTEGLEYAWAHCRYSALKTSFPFSETSPWMQPVVLAKKTIWRALHQLQSCKVCSKVQEQKMVDPLTTNQFSSNKIMYMISLWRCC